MLLGGASEALAQTGTISGTVTGSLTPLPNTEVHFYNLAGSGDGVAGVATTNALGNYTINLPPGSYGVLTQNTLGFINEIYDNIPCSAVCNVDDLVEVIVTNGSNFVANFDLAPGGRIAGRITDSVTGLGIAGVRVLFVPSTGEVAFTFATTDSNGDYISDGGTVTGTVYAVTMNTLGYQNELWDDIKCGDCDWLEVGTPMPVTIGVTTGGFDFDLDIGGTISGTVRDANLAPIMGVEVTVVNASGDAVDFGLTDASGNYTTGGLPTGTYYLVTNQDVGYVDEAYNNIPCINGNCDATMGQPIAVTVGANTPGIDFVLQMGGNITGTITNAATGLPILDNVFVQFMDAAGNFVGGANTDKDTGQFIAQGVPPGTYYAIVGYAGFFNQMYNGLTCTTNCNVLLSTPIHVTAGVTTANINFALQPTTAVGTITGTVMDITGGLPGVPVNSMNVQVLTLTGGIIANGNTSPGGVYNFPNLPVGSYYVRTNVGNQLINQLHNGVVCINCNVTTSGGTPVPVTAGGTAIINFNLTAGGRISGTITNAAGGAVLSGIGVQLFSASGVSLGMFNTNPSGVFTTRGLPDGTYYLRTNNNQGFVDELYDNVYCPGSGCNVLSGTPVVVAGTGTVANRNFQLVAGGRISGTITAPAGIFNLQFGSQVGVFTEGGVFLGNIAPTDGVANYTTFALPAGRYFLRTINSLGLVDELYDNIPCAGCSITAGTPVDVTTGVITTGKNFTLVRGGHIAGTVTNAVSAAPIANVRVGAFLADGTMVKSAFTNSNGEYSILGLPVGTYYARTSIVNGLFYQDELYNELPCSPTCVLTTGAPITLTAGVTEGGKNFTLTPGGGIISGTVREQGTAAPLGLVIVQFYLPNGTLAKTVNANVSGQYQVTLPAGTYYARTAVTNASTHLDELYNELPCTPTCNPATGAPITVVDAATQSNIDFTLAPNLVKNGRFESGMANWTLFSTPDPSYLVSQLTNGVFEYYRVPPPPGTANQAVIFQWTGVPLAANAPVVARFSLGNSSSVRKRISVLVLDSDFTDLSVCTFWLAPNTPLTPYRMITHSTKAWTNTAIYFYAATAGSNGGFYQVDDVSIEYAPAESNAETTCVDPTAPVAPPGIPDGPELLVNGNFEAGVIAPWGALFNITWQLAGGVFEFIRAPNPPPGTPAGVVLQVTGQAVPANSILTATFQLGNSSPVRKRVTVIIHDQSFTDLSACTFWLAPGQPLSDYTYRTFTTQNWTNATLSVYPATTGVDQWIRLDNVSFRRTPSTAIVGTECIEPGGSLAPSGSIARAIGSAFTIGGGAASAGGDVGGPQVLQSALALDLTHASSATLAFGSWLATPGSWGELQVRGDDGEWTTLRVIGGTDDWTPIAVDLADYLGQVVDVRLVFYQSGGAPGVWRVSEIAIDVRR